MADTKKLTKMIVGSSEAKNYKEAILEWEIDLVFPLMGNPENCICGTRNTTVVYEIVNMKNRKTLNPIGRKCIKRLSTHSYQISEHNRRIEWFLKNVEGNYLNVSPEYYNKIIDFSSNEDWGSCRKMICTKCLELKTVGEFVDEKKNRWHGVNKTTRDGTPYVHNVEYKSTRVTKTGTYVVPEYKVDGGMCYECSTTVEIKKIMKVVGGKKIMKVVGGKKIEVSLFD